MGSLRATAEHRRPTMRPGFDMMHHAPRSRRVRRVVATTCLLLASFSPLANAQSGTGYTGSDTPATPRIANSNPTVFTEATITNLLAQPSFRPDPVSFGSNYGPDFVSVVLLDIQPLNFEGTEGLGPFRMEFELLTLNFGRTIPITISVGSTLTKLGVFTPDAGGKINANITLPASLEAGDHHLFFQGVDPAGKPRVVGLEFKVEGVSANRLALTGSNPSNLVAIGGLLIVVGVAGTAAARRRMQATAAVQSNNSTK